jgi:transcriptional regulator with XRE-family HTH domain
MSTIAKHSIAGGGTSFSKALGAEIRRRRVALGLSQDSVGRPLSRAFLSSVETGRSVPSLPSLLMIARRLNSTGAAILASAESELEERYDDADADKTAIPR